MYLPKLFESQDRPLLLELMQRYSFATVIAIRDGLPEISHLPLMILDGDPLRIQGHVAKQNPLLELLAQGAPLTCIFHGPHAYVSPRIYINAANVPTWNYAVVHAHGRSRLLEPEAVVPHLRALVSLYESSAEKPWKMEDGGELPLKLVAGLVAFELVVEKLEGKLKLNQNRLPEDWRGVVANFESSANAEEREVAVLMKRITPGGR